MEKKSLISTLKTTKKANVAAFASNEGASTRKITAQRAISVRLRRTAKAR